MELQPELLKVETQAEKKFLEFHDSNPHVYRQLVKMAKQLKERGHQRGSIQMLFEVIRWQSMLKTTDTDYKLNNNYASRYARMIMLDYPELDGFFETRTLKS